MYGEKIRTLRKQRGLTQTQLAALLGMKQHAIANIENGLTQFTGVDKLRRIADALDVPLDVLVDDDQGSVTECAQSPEPA